MAQKRTQGARIDEEDPYCDFCFDLLKYPVKIPCGHNFCINCIETHRDEEEERGTNSCPLCRKTFNLSGPSEKTTALPALVEQLKKISLQSAPDDSCLAGPEHVACDVCTGRKLKAINFCFTCEVFYCSAHVHSHFDDPPLKKHKISKNICSHDDTVSAAAKRTERQRELEERLGSIQQEIQDREKDFSCSICLDRLKDPVTIPCGHSYCMNCINDHWDEEDMRGIHSCPQCRETFLPRPVLKKNVVLASIVEQLKKTGLQATPADHHYTLQKDVACDFCTGRRHKAIKSCLVCQDSYCEEHLQPHYDETQLKTHKLVEPSRNIQENIWSCHDTVSTAADRAERQRELEERRGNIQQRIQDREKDVKLLQQEVEAINHSADKTVEDSKKIFTELIRLLQKRRSDVKQQIRSQQETEVSRVKDVQEKLEQEITELKRKDAELEQLSHTEDHNQFLLNYPSLPALSESTHSSSINIRPLRHFEDVTAAVSQLREKLQDVLRDSWTNISLMVTEVDVLLSEPEPGPEPTTRAEFLRYSCEITLDPNTAHEHLVLSEGNRKVTKTYNSESSSHPDRFTGCEQVLSKESLTGRCYWEVEWTDINTTVAVAYKTIRRIGEGNQCRFGYNDRSWALDCSQNTTRLSFLKCENYEFLHNNSKTSIFAPDSSTIGVYLDHRAGILAFYSVSETMTLIHRVQTTFTRPLHAGVLLHYYDDTAEFCQLK